MTTLIGTPPNLIVSADRAKTGTTGFGMFDFTPDGLAVAVTGVVFLVFLGWRLVPVREPAGAEGFDIGAYLTEARVAAGSKAAGAAPRDIGTSPEAADAQVIGLVRNEYRVSAPSQRVARDTSGVRNTPSAAPVHCPAAGFVKRFPHGIPRRGFASKPRIGREACPGGGRPLPGNPERVESAT